MKIAKKVTVAGLIGAALLLALPTASMAQSLNRGWYGAASFGQSDLGPDKDTAWRIAVGNQFHRNFAAELGYTDLGSITVAGTKVSATAFELLGVGSFEVAPKVSLYGKLGVASIDVKAGGASDKENKLTYGFGAQYDFTPKVGLQGEFRKYQTDGDDIDVLSLGVVFRFN